MRKPFTKVVAQMVQFLSSNRAAETVVEQANQTGAENEDIELADPF